ncbi:MAG TPA: hypothetical protein IAB13_05745, partial [Candidatus Avanaerovorax faecigallinarum]|nr:hypothetical protein [Candidatus Avanaerovorax faecigallinarum]
MKKHITGFRLRRKFVTAVLVFTMLFAMACVSYAATDGQIFENIKLWINGEAYEGELTQTEDGAYVFDIKPGHSAVIESDGGKTEIDAGENGGGATIE